MFNKNIPLSVVLILIMLVTLAVSMKQMEEDVDDSRIEVDPTGLRNMHDDGYDASSESSQGSFIYGMNEVEDRHNVINIYDDINPSSGNFTVRSFKPILLEKPLLPEATRQAVLKNDTNVSNIKGATALTENTSNTENNDIVKAFPIEEYMVEDEQYSDDVVKLLQEIKVLQKAGLEFYNTYGDIAGDITNIPDVKEDVYKGNGDGKISDITESVMYWQHLASVGLIKLNKIEKNIDWDNVDLSKLVPNIGLENVIVMPIYVRSQDESGKNMLMIATINKDKIDGGALTPKQAQQIDSFLDDGSPVSEKGDGSLGVLSANSGAQESLCIKDGKYNLENTEKTCRIYIGINL